MNHKKNKPSREEINSWIELKFNELQAGKIAEIAMLSGSMMPLLVPGKKIRVEPVNPIDIQIGDIVVFKDRKGLTAHRVLLKLHVFHKQYFLQKGDANRYGSFIDEKHIRGRVIAVVINDTDYSDLKSDEKRKIAKRQAIVELFKYIINILLIFPRSIKHALIRTK